MKSILLSRKTWAAAAILLAAGGLLFWQHKPILAWYYVRQLAGAYPENRDGWANRAAALEEAALPRLLDGMHDADAMVCANMQYAIFLMAKKWGLNDPRTLDLVEQMHLRFRDFSSAGREKALLTLTSLMHVDRRADGGAEAQEEAPPPLPPRLTMAIGEMMVNAEKQDELRGVSLLLAAELIDAVQPGQWVDVGREMAERGLRHPAAGRGWRRCSFSVAGRCGGTRICSSRRCPCFTMPTRPCARRR